MNPVGFLVRLAATAFVAAGVVALIARKTLPSHSNALAGAVHFKKGFEEFGKGVSTVLFGQPSHPEEDLKERREASRIAIE